MIITDKDIQEIARGSISAYQSFFDVFYRPLCTFCYEKVKDHDQAADLAQETMIKFWDSRAKHSNIGQAKVYLYTIARNLCLNYLRDNKKFFGEPLENKEAQEIFINTLMQEELMIFLHKAIEDLPAQTRKIIELTLKGYSNAEIGSELGISVNTVKTLKKNGYKKLKEGPLKNIYLFLLCYSEDLFPEGAG